MRTASPTRKSRTKWRAGSPRDEHQVSAEARDELLEAVAYYEGEASSLGWRLWEEVERHIAWVERNYEVPRMRPGGYRRVNLKLFPYYISYIVRESVIWILAIAHGHRRPEYWIDRPRNIR